MKPQHYGALKEDLTLISLESELQSWAANDTGLCVQINGFSGLSSGRLVPCKIRTQMLMWLLTSPELL